MVVADKKTMEGRRCCWKNRRILIGRGVTGATGEIVGVCEVTDSRMLSGEEEWERLRPLHCIEGALADTPYGGHVCLMTLANVCRSATPIPFQRRLGQVGRALFRSIVANDEVPSSNAPAALWFCCKAKEAPVFC